MMKQFPNLKREQAEEILRQQGQKEASWKSHSRLVAQTASTLARALKDQGRHLDEEYIYGAALLHDIGRSSGHGVTHGLEGYKLLSRLGYPHYARFCLTHWLKGRDIEEARQDSDNDMNWKELEELAREARVSKLSLEDKIVILADGLCLADERVSVEERCRDWEKRYGENPWIEKSKEVLYEIRGEMEELLNRPLKEIFPELQKSDDDGFPYQGESSSKRPEENTSRPEKNLQDPGKLTHLDSEGAAQMVDISSKKATARIARAVGYLSMKGETLKVARRGEGKKGDAFQVARLAGIMGAKKTSQLIPLCHPLPLTSIEVKFDFPTSQKVKILTTAKTTYGTGVEMEALTAASTAALTLYDMLKGIDKTMVIEKIHLLEKKGGKSGDFHWEE